MKVTAEEGECPRSSMGRRVHQIDLAHDNTWPKAMDVVLHRVSNTAWCGIAPRGIINGCQVCSAVANQRDCTLEMGHTCFWRVIGFFSFSIAHSIRNIVHFIQNL